MQELIKNPLGNTERLTMRIANAELDVLSGRGGGLVGWRVNGMELLEGYASEEELQARYYSSHCGVRLVPFPNRLKDGAWNWHGKPLQLPKNFPWENGHAIHGLLFDLPWREVSCEKMEKEFADGSKEYRLVLTLRCKYDGKMEGYPFPFTAETQYILKAQGMEIVTSITNDGTHEMPFGEGWHPYFNAQCKVDECMLEMNPATLKVEIDDRSIPTGVLVPDDSFATLSLIGEQQINTCWQFAGPEDLALATVTFQNPSTGLTFHYWQERGTGKYNYIQLYTPPHRNTLAIEPMTCPPDVLNNHMGEIYLAPGATHRLRYGVDVTTTKA